MSDKIKAGLAKLDVKNDNHWTEEGLPRIEAVRLLAGDSSLTREQITAADPMFNRMKATPDAPAADPAVITPASDPVLAPVATEADVHPHAKNPSVKHMLEQEFEEATVALDEVLERKIAMDAEYDLARARLDKVVTALDRFKEPDHKTVMSAIQAYQRTSNAVRAERGQRYADLKAAGIRLQDIIPQRAPIDASRQRKR